MDVSYYLDAKVCGKGTVQNDRVKKTVQKLKTALNRFC